MGMVKMEVKGQRWRSRCGVTVVMMTAANLVDMQVVLEVGGEDRVIVLMVVVGKVREHNTI